MRTLQSSVKVRTSVNSRVVVSLLGRGRKHTRAFVRTDDEIQKRSDNASQFSNEWFDSRQSVRHVMSFTHRIALIREWRTNHALPIVYRCCRSKRTTSQRCTSELSTLRQFDGATTLPKSLASSWSKKKEASMEVPNFWDFPLVTSTRNPSNGNAPRQKLVRVDDKNSWTTCQHGSTSTMTGDERNHNQFVPVYSIDSLWFQPAKGLEDGGH